LVRIADLRRYQNFERNLRSLYCGYVGMRLCVNHAMDLLGSVKQYDVRHDRHFHLMSVIEVHSNLALSDAHESVWMCFIFEHVFIGV